eukprot:GEMP01016745.1.p1 GENE.GEMP01016745.1~~GEMP01016745.1.p1  ORF type:complete len:649 (+),score=85.80 GEMP01016745.1:157-2103(+)
MCSLLHTALSALAATVFPLRLLLWTACIATWAPHGHATDIHILSLAHSEDVDFGAVVDARDTAAASKLWRDRIAAGAIHGSQRTVVSETGHDTSETGPRVEQPPWVAEFDNSAYTMARATGDDTVAATRKMQDAVFLTSPKLLGVPTVDTTVLHWDDECYKNGVAVPCDCGREPRYKVQRADVLSPSVWRVSVIGMICTPAECTVRINFVSRSYMFRVIMVCGARVVISAPSTAIHLPPITNIEDATEEQTTIAIWDVTVYSLNGLIPSVSNDVFFWSLWSESEVALIEVMDTIPGPLLETGRDVGRTSIVPVVVEYLRTPDPEDASADVKQQMLHRLGFEIKSVVARASEGPDGAQEDSYDSITAGGLIRVNNIVEQDEKKEIEPVGPESNNKSQFHPALMVLVITCACAMVLLYLYGSYQYYVRVVVGNEKLSEWLDVYIFTSVRVCRCWMMLDEIQGKKPRFLFHWVRYHLLLVFGFLPLGFIHSRIQHKVDTMLHNSGSKQSCNELLTETLILAICPYDLVQRLPGQLEQIKANADPDRRRNTDEDDIPNDLLPLESDTGPELGEIVLCSSHYSKHLSSPTSTRSSTSQASKARRVAWGRRWVLFGDPNSGRLYWYNPSTKVVIWKDEIRSPAPRLHVPDNVHC